jgi:hypothetical protein
MNGLLDDVLVGILLAAACGYAVFSLGPRTLRGRLMAAAGAVLFRVPAVFGLRTIAQRLASTATVKSTGGCGGCDNCGSEQTPEPQSTDGELRIPVSKITRRS